MRYVVFLSLLSCAAASAQPAPSATQLLSAYVTRLGGEEKIRALQTVAMRGTLDNPDDGTKVPVEVKAKAPNLYSRILHWSDTDVSQLVFAGAAGWTRDPENGPRPMSKADVAAALLDYDLLRAVRLAELYTKLGSPKKAALDGKEAWSIEASTDSGVTETWWFDPATNLLLCREYERVTMEDGILKIREFYADYKEVEGIKFPGTVRQAMPDYEMLYRFDEVKVNQPLEDSVFSKPQ